MIRNAYQQFVKVVVTTGMVVSGLSMTSLVTPARASGISMTNFNGSLFQLIRGENNQPFVRTSNSITWSGWTPVDGGTFNAPAVSTYSNRLYLAVRGGDNRVYVRSFDGANWSGWAALDGGTLVGPALSYFGNKLYLAVRGTDNGIFIRSFNGTTWEGWSRLNGGTLNSPALAPFGNKLYLAVRGSDNGIFISSFNGSTWSAWGRLDGSTRTAPSLAFFGNKLYLSVRGEDNQIYTRAFDGATWSAWDRSAGIDVFSPPSIVAYGNKLYQSYQGGDNFIYTRSFDGQSWSSWSQMGGGTPSEPDDLDGASGPGRLFTVTSDIQRSYLGIALNTTNYQASGNPFVLRNGTGGTTLWCTDFAYGRAWERGLLQLNPDIMRAINVSGSAGNAGNWDDNVFKVNPSKVGNTARSQSLVVWDPFMGGAGEVGHVGFVEAVFNDGSFLVSEANWDQARMSFNLRRVAPGSTAFRTAKFIYLR